MSAYFEGFAISHGEVRLPDWLMKMDISKGAKLTYNVLAICSRGHEYTWPSQAFLAGRLSSSVRTVQRHLGELVSQGLIEKGQDYVKGKIRRVYRFLTACNDAVNAASQRHDNMSPGALETQKNLSSNTTICRTKGDKLSCALNKEETIKGNNKYPPTPQPTLPVAPPDPNRDLAGKEEDFSPEWIEAKKILEQNLDAKSFQTWIVPLSFERNGSEVILRCSNNFFCRWVKNNFGSQIGTALESLGLTGWKLEALTAEQQEQIAARQEKAEKLQKETARAAALAAASPDEAVDSLPLEEQFERLYGIYPKVRQEAKYDGYEAFCDLHRQKKLPKTSVLIAAVKHAKNNNSSWRRNDGQYVPQLKKWLYRRRWLD